jgi:hypothetical protein
MFKEVKLTKNENGFASIVVALTIIIILALLTVVFAQLARREQQSSLDKQLAIQATYAAESGINDVVKYLASIPLGNDATKCITDPAILPSLPASSTVSGQTGASYSCVLVDKQPKDVIFGHVSPDNGRYSTFTTSDKLDTMTIEWRSADNNNSLTPDLSTRFPSKANWKDATGNYQAVVQLTIVPLSSLKRDDLINNAFTIYVYPSKVAGGTAQYPTDNGNIVSGGCNPANTYPCKVTISGLNSDRYILHVQTYYDDSTDIRITGSNNTTGPVTNTDQTVIDVTGKARNVLKRLQVRVQTDQAGTIYDQPALPDNALEGQNICKRMWTQPANTDYVKVSGSALSLPTSDPCYLSN